MKIKIEKRIINMESKMNTALNNKDRETEVYVIEKHDNDIGKIERNLRKNLETIGVTYDDLNPKLKEHFQKIEGIIINTFETQKNAKKMLKNNNLKLKNISKKSEISRQTFYNNPILKDYIELRDKEFQKTNVFSVNEDKTNEIRRLNDELNMFKNRDFQYMNMKEERDSLLKEIEQLKIYIKKLENEKKESGLNQILKVIYSKDRKFQNEI